jgi:large subunit ribosomal protein L6
MSRIGRAPIPLPSSVTFDYDNAFVTVKGPNGLLSQNVPREMLVECADGVITVRRPTESATHRSLHGLTRTLIANMVEGVTNGFEKRLEIVGVGYRASLKGSALEMLIGFSHPVQIEAPEGIVFEVPQPTTVVVKGADKQVVGEIAAEIRRLRPPEPYKGKGIRYEGEHVQRKVGKRA